MRPGTPGFSGSRLRSAREARGLSGAVLAELVEVSRSAISQYERGIQTPSPKVVQEIADKLCEIGVDFVQGFGIAQPQPLNALKETSN